MRMRIIPTKSFGCCALALKTNPKEVREYPHEGITRKNNNQRKKKKKVGFVVHVKNIQLETKFKGPTWISPWHQNKDVRISQLTQFYPSNIQLLRII